MKFVIKLRKLLLDPFLPKKTQNKIFPLKIIYLILKLYAAVMSCKFYFEPILDWFMATFGPKTSTQNLPQENHINVKSLCYGNNIQKNQRESNATLFNKTWKTTFCVSFFSFNNYATLCKKSQKLSVKFSYLSPSRVPLYQKKKIFLKKIIKSILKTYVPGASCRKKQKFRPSNFKTTCKTFRQKFWAFLVQKPKQSIFQNIQLRNFLKQMTA